MVGVVKAAVRRYYGFDQTTNIGNAGWTQLNVVYVDIVPTSASNYIKLVEDYFLGKVQTQKINIVLDGKKL